MSKLKLKTPHGKDLAMTIARDIQTGAVVGQVTRQPTAPDGYGRVLLHLLTRDGHYVTVPASSVRLDEEQPVTTQSPTERTNVSNLHEPGSRNVPMVSVGTTKAAEIFDNKPDNQWLNPIAMQQLKRAVKDKAIRVVLNGREYSISYGHVFGKLVRRECVLVKPVSGISVPMGYVSLKRIRDFKFSKGE